MFCRTFLKISWITEMDNPNVLQKIRYRSIDHKYQKEAVAIFWSDCEKIKSITCKHDMITEKNHEKRNE